MLRLFATTKFAPLFFTQFGGAMNDNMYKNAFAVLLVYTLAPEHGYDAKFLVNITQAIFILPFILFAATAGALGDIYDKALIIRRIKILEILIIILAIMAFYLENIPLLMLIIFLLSVQSTFFGPVKYSIIPHHIPEHLVNANALLTAGTFLAIITGTLLGGYLASIEHGLLWLSPLLLAVAAVGYLSSLFIPHAPPITDKDKGSTVRIRYNIFAAIGELLGHIFRKRRHLVALLLGVSWFWFIGSVLLTQIPIMTGEYLLLEGRSVSVFMLIFACGIGTGAILCSLILKGKATDRFALWTSLLLGILIIDTSLAIDSVSNSLQPAPGEQYIALEEFFSDWRGIRLCLDFSLLSVVGGCYVLPIFALLQSQAAPRERARVIAANNIMNSLFMVTSAIMTIGIYALGGDIYLLFKTLGAGCLVVSLLWFGYLRKSPYRLAND